MSAASWCPSCEDRDPRCMACAGHGYERVQRGLPSVKRCNCGNPLVPGASICVDCPPRAEGVKAPADAFLTEGDFASLFTFYNQITDTDADGYTVPKADMQRLSELGCVSDEGRGRYSMTRFGDWIIESSFLQNPTLPLQTIDDYNAASAAKAGISLNGSGVPK